MQPVDTTSANHHAHDFSSLPLSIDTELAASKAILMAKSGDPCNVRFPKVNQRKK